MTPAFRYTLLWIAGSIALVIAALSLLSGAYVDGHYVPSTPDAFYHARRILDSVVSGEPVAEFDALILQPEGSRILWPWGFDTVMATIVGWFGPFPDETAAAAVLVHLPVAAVPLAVAWLVLLWRQLQLSLPAAALATIGLVALPLVVFTFAVGNVDHHFAELLWALLALCTGMAFFRSTDGVLPAVLLGASLGTAVAVSNPLFILQVPVVAAFAWRWLRREPLPPRRAVFALAATLVATTLLVSIESDPWRRGLFEFYSLSWFHSYLAATTGAFLVVLATVRPRGATIAWITLGAAIAAVPLLRSAGLGARYVSGDLNALRNITEVMSPYELYALFGPAQSTRTLSWLMWLALPALVANLYWAVRARESGRQFFAIAAVLFLILLQLQYRFAVFGVVPLLATLALALDAAAARWPARARWQIAVAALALVAALMPTRDVWRMRRPLGGDPFYADVYPGLMELRAACEQRPGTVLAAVNDGHWVRYHTRCGVIANMLLMTEQSARKRLEVETLLATDPERLRRDRPDVAYVLVHGELELFVPVRPDGSHGEGVLRWRSEIPALTRTLLGEEESIPPGYRVLWSSYLPDGQALARILEVERQ